MEANQQSLGSQQTWADRGNIQEWVRHTDDIICSQQPCPDLNVVTGPMGQYKFSPACGRHFPTIKRGPAAMPQTASTRQVSSAPDPQSCGCTHIP